MRYVAAYLLAALGGNASPSAKDIKNILGSVGIEADDERLNKVWDIYYNGSYIEKKNLLIHGLLHFIVISLQVIGELNGKDINQVMNSGEDLLTKHSIADFERASFLFLHLFVF